MSSLIERELAENDRADIWNVFYHRIKNEASLKHMDDKKYTVSAARKAENRSKNRYRDVSPYDHSRVVIEKGHDDYLNASIVQVPEANRKYILAQGPLEHTTGNFWQAVWEQESKAIIMLNRIIEKGSVKCYQYWPLGLHNDDEDEMLFEDVELKVTLLHEEDFDNFTKRLFSLEDLETGEKRDVLHFHYTTWPDFGVPSSPTAFLNFLMVVRETGVLESDCGPSVIHCSAGIGRSGTFCLVDSCLVLIEKKRSLECVDIRNMLIDMRSYRMGLIQTADQLRFSYLAVLEGGKRLLQLPDANSNLKDIENDQEKKEDRPPTPPTRSTSLPKVTEPDTADEPPAIPQKKSKIQFPDSEYESPSKSRKIEEEEIFDRPSPQKRAKLPKDDVVDDGSRLNGLPEPTEFNIDPKSDEGEEDTVEFRELRRRVREEKKKHTAEKVKHMKEKQRKSEIWKERKSYIKPICIGLSLIIGSYLLYRYCWR